MTPEEILSEAARLVEKGWCQGRLRSGLGVCAVGAILDAGRSDNGLNVAVSALVQEIGTPDIGRWNDTPGRTKEEVATALRNAKRWL